MLIESIALAVTQGCEIFSRVSKSLRQQDLECYLVLTAAQLEVVLVETSLGVMMSLSYLVLQQRLIDMTNSTSQALRGTTGALRAGETNATRFQT